MIADCIIRHSRIGIHKPTHAVFLLHGRGGNSDEMMQAFLPLVEINKLVIFSIGPEKEWYPIPNGSNDQEEAVLGLCNNLEKIRSYIAEKISEYEIPEQNVILIGFSAGAVVALSIVTYLQAPYGMAISHSGAILDLERIKNCSVPTKIKLIHRWDDLCFSWDERYVPMKTTLENKNYNLEFQESGFGNHMVYKNDIIEIKNWVSDFVS